MTIELHGFVEIITPITPVVSAPRSFARMNERLAVYDGISAMNDAAGSVQGIDELHRRGHLAQLHRRREALAVMPGEFVPYIATNDPSTDTTMRHRKA